MGTFGETLRKEREKRGITLENVSEATKIGTRFLRALEAEQFEQLPGGVFNKGFVRAYAKHVGLDEEKTVADYLAASGPSTPAPPETPPNQPAASDKPKPARSNASEAIRITETQETARFENLNDFIRRMPWTELATVVLLAVGIIAGWRYVLHRGHAAAATAASKSAAPGAKPVVAPPPSLQLVIHAGEDSWLSVTTDGAAQGEVMLLAGESKTVQADRDILVKAGNAGGLTFTWNGSKLPTQGEEAEVVTLDFDRSGVKKVPPQPAETMR